MSDAPLFGPDDDVADTEALLRELDADDLETVSPPADVWRGIEAAIRDEQMPTDLRSDREPVAGRSTRLRAAILSAAAAVVLIAIGAIAVVTTGGDVDDVLASAELVHRSDFDPLGAGAEATARLIERNGRLEIRLDELDLPDPAADDLELWLIAPADDGSLDVQPVSLVDPDSSGSYAVPDGLDPDEYSIVDISIEPRDGDPAHSGRSILRGTLADT